MGIYIKGMKMPRHCGECELGDIVCEFDEDHIDCYCPLIGVSEPHGRLIDADMAYQETMKYDEHFRKSVLNVINNLPTVIESEVEE